MKASIDVSKIQVLEIKNYDLLSTQSFCDYTNRQNRLLVVCTGLILLAFITSTATGIICYLFVMKFGAGFDTQSPENNFLPGNETLTNFGMLRVQNYSFLSYDSDNIACGTAHSCVVYNHTNTRSKMATLAITLLIKNYLNKPLNYAALHYNLLTAKQEFFYPIPGSYLNSEMLPANGQTTLRISFLLPDKALKVWLQVLEQGSKKPISLYLGQLSTEKW